LRICFITLLLPFTEDCANKRGKTLTRRGHRIPSLGRECHGLELLESLRLLVEVVVLVVLRSLQCQLKGETLLGDLVDPHPWSSLDGSRVSGARTLCLGRRVGLRISRPARVQKVSQRLFVFKNKNHPIVLHSHSKPGPGRNHLHERFLLCL